MWCPFSPIPVSQTQLQNRSRLRASEAAVHEGNGGPAGPAEPAQHHSEEVRGGREESRLLPVSGKSDHRAFSKCFNSLRSCAIGICTLPAGFQRNSCWSYDIHSFIGRLRQTDFMFVRVMGMNSL